MTQDQEKELRADLANNYVGIVLFKEIDRLREEIDQLRKENAIISQQRDAAIWEPSLHSMEDILNDKPRN